MNRKELIAEITTELKQYDDSGLIDYISLNNWIRNALREFGGNIMQNDSTVIDVVNGRAKLPDNFYSLYVALKCEPYQYYTEKKNKKHLQSSVFWTERLENPSSWENTSEAPCLPGMECRFIKEETYFIDSTNNQRNISLYYNNPTVLRLKKGYNKLQCERDCLNIRINNSPYEITIEGAYIHANFNEGKIFLQYRGLPIDEDGDLVIPEIQRNKLTEYIQYTCIRRVLQSLLLNSDDPNVSQKWQLYRQLEKETYIEAKNDTVNEGLSGWADDAKRSNRLRNIKYELMFKPI